MILRYDPDFIEKLKGVNVKVRKSFKERIDLFNRDPSELQLNNHPLRDDWEGYRSIDVTDDWRAVYTEKTEGRETIAYFVEIYDIKNRLLLSFMKVKISILNVSFIKPVSKQLFRCWCYIFQIFARKPCVIYFRSNISRKL